MSTRFESVEAYFAAQSPANRIALQALRRVILEAAPGARELISYNIPAFRTDDGVIVFIGAAARHCAIYAVSQSTIEACRPDLAKFETSGKGTIRFSPGSPLSDDLVARIVRLQLTELEVGSKLRTRRNSAKKI